MNSRIAVVTKVAFAMALVGLTLTPHRISSAQTEPFYKGKTVRIIVGSTTGGLYDRWARLLARYMGKHIPGSPEFIVQNMPGAGSLVAVNYLYNVAKPDGLAVIMPLNNIYLDQLSGRKEVKFDIRNIHWIGSPEKQSIILYMRADAPYKSVADIIRAKEPPRCGGSGTSSSDYILAKILEEALGAKLNTVLGYQGGSEVDVAVERGEVICRGMGLSGHFAREPFVTWHKNHFDRHIVQSGRVRDPRAPDTPTVYELMEEYKTRDVTRRVAQVILSGGDFGRPMGAPPGTPADSVAALRQAHARAMSDPELIAEAKRSKMDVEPISGEELQALVKEVMDQPPDVIERVRKILGN